MMLKIKMKLIYQIYYYIYYYNKYNGTKGKYSKNFLDKYKNYKNLRSIKKNFIKKKIKNYNINKEKYYVPIKKNIII